MAENHVLLETIELSQSASSVTFDNIPQTGYTDLKVVLSTRSVGSTSNWLNLSFNGSTANFTFRHILNNFGSVISQNSTTGRAGVNNNTSMVANSFSSSEIYIPNYTSANNKIFSLDATGEDNGSTTVMQTIYAGLWSVTSAITSITITPDASTLAQYSTFSLYGLAATGTTPTTAPKASGGNIVANDGTYWYHAFLSSGTFTPVQTLSCDALVISGGGGGGGGFGAGGGAGGVRLSSGLSISTANLVTVGSGGSAGTSSLRGSSGVASSIGSIASSVGGGAGGTAATGLGAGLSGGSGGGASYEFSGTWSIQAAGSGTSGEGNNGGTSTRTGFADGSGGAGGGGGAGAVGGTGSTNTGGAGGAGTNTYSSWATATATGVSGYYGGGGGAGAGTTGGSGGAGGGGNGGGGDPSSGTAAIRNTGGGGGGARGGAGSPGAGGSGLVIIRYTIA